MVKRALFLGVVRVLVGLATAIGLGFDFSGTSLLGMSSDNLRLVILITFVAFIGLTAYREIGLLLRPRPKVQYTRLFPDSAFTKYPLPDEGVTEGMGYFTRLVFQNNAPNPSGANSAARKLTAKVKVFELKDNQIREDSPVDSWDGRWANTNRPNSAGEIWEKNAINLEANGQEAILDIGFRFSGRQEFIGWDNLQYFKVARIPINPGPYSAQVVLKASNWVGKEWRFSLNIPSEPQSDNLYQVEVESIKKPNLRRVSSQTE